MTAGDLERGRGAYLGHAWKSAHELLFAADAQEPLGADDLELLATCAYMLGRDHEYVDILERAHDLHLEVGETPRAVRCAFWCGMTLALRGEMGPGGAWLGRAQRMLEEYGEECVERGYLLMPLMFRHEAAGDFETAAAVATEAASIARRFGDADGLALASLGRGQMLVKAGGMSDGLAVLDEAMLAVTRGEVSPIPAGMVYCGVILACQDAFDIRRAQEWTAELTRWCAGQPDLVAFTGRCLVHRSEILQLEGAWSDALQEAKRARERFVEVENVGRVGLAAYREAELQRLLGDVRAAEQSYREASRHGWDPQPGLAQLRLAQGNVAAARAAVGRALAETVEPVRRVPLLAASVEISLAAGDVQGAADACGELQALAGTYESVMLEAMAAYARGAVELAAGDAKAALSALRAAAEHWQRLGVPYEVARTRELVGRCCSALADDEAADLEFDAARLGYERLGAVADATRLGSDGRRTHGLTPRELEVLRLVAAGRSNREIATELVISEHTVARHVQNIFAKLDVSSRTAAASFAFEHELV